MKFSIVPVQDIKYIVIKQILFSFLLKFNTFLLMTMPLQVSPCSDTTFIIESFVYYYQILSQMPFSYYFALLCILDFSSPEFFLAHCFS